MRRASAWLTEHPEYRSRPDRERLIETRPERYLVAVERKRYVGLSFHWLK